MDSSVDAAEVAKFARIAEEWWDVNGKFRPLHLFNPVRLAFIREAAAAYFGRDPKSLRPFAGLSLLDIGCGGGLVAEPMARLGFTVLGADAGEENIRCADLHAAGSGLDLAYRVTTAEALADAGKRFDVVLSLEVIEHVVDPGAFLKSCARLVAPGGILIVATINRTLKSLALAKVGAEYVLRWLPMGTHDWTKFIRPDELTRMMSAADLKTARVQGMGFDPLRWEWRLSSDTDVNYAIVAEPAQP